MPFALAGSYAVYARGGARSLHDVDVIDLIHTLSFGEVTEIWAFLGNYLLGEAVDAAGCDLAVHGHAHAGTEKGATEGGTPGAERRPAGDPQRLRAVRHHARVQVGPT